MQGIRLTGALLVTLLISSAGIALAAEGDSATEASEAALAASAAPKPSPGVELKEDRTASSMTYRLPNGALQARIFASPINYRDGEGQWTPIGDRLEEGDAAALRNGPNGFDVTLPTRMGAGSVDLSVEGATVSYNLVGPASAPVQLDGETARYEAADPGVAFEFTGLANGLKEAIEIADPSAPHSFHFELNASSGVTPMLTKHGSIEFRDADDHLVAESPAPVMFDSSPTRPQTSDAVHYELAPVGEGSWQLTVAANPQWLAQPDLVWPVRIDPTLTIPTPSLDCTYGVTATGPPGWGACGSGGYTTLLAGYWPELSGPEEWARSALRFPLDSMPKGAYIEGATLGLYSPTTALNTSGVEARRATKYWNTPVNWSRYATDPPELGGGDLLWSQQGGDFTSEGAAVTTSERGSQPGWWNFSGAGMTDLVRKWIASEVPNDGVLVKLQDDKSKECGPTSCTDRSVDFASSATADSSKRPYMAITYYPQSPEGRLYLPKDGARTASQLTLKAGWPDKTATAVTFQFKLPDWQNFETIPPELVRGAKGQQVSWPMPVEGIDMAPIYFDAASHPALKGALIRRFQIRALFEGTSKVAGYGEPVNITLDRIVGGPRDATTTVGPGAVNLLTGNFTVSKTDVSIPVFDSALEFSRSHTSRQEITEDNTGVLGRGWKPGVPVEAAGGAEWRSVSEVVATAEEKEEGFGDYALLTDLEGYGYAFELVGGSYIAPPELSGWVLAKQGDGTFTLTDPDGNRTTFENPSGGSEYLPVSVSQTGGATNKTRMVYQLVNGARRLSMIIAPSAAGITCTEANATTTLGCRALIFSYQPATTWGAPSSYGDRLSTIKFYGPSGASMASWEVAKYNYDSQGRLTEEWDPRIAPALKETYTYESFLIRTIRPPGEEPWTIDYYPAGEESQGGRLKSVRRPTLLESPSTAQTTVVYDVPISGSGAPYDMSGSAIAQWGQEDLPLDATAIFPPDQIPAEPPSSYSRATVLYMDADGQLVNTATPSGAGTSTPSITTAEIDEYGNVVRELSAQNRLRALAEGANSVARSHELETKRLFKFEGTEMREEWGPLHEVRLESGSTVQARMHTTIQYDEGAPAPPAGTPPSHLPTRETVGAAIAGQAVDADKRVTETKYDWTLRKPTDVIVDPEGLNLRTHTEYDAISGLVTERRLPANPNGGDARTTKIAYYSAGSSNPDESCKEKPQYANLPCKVRPASQPGTVGQPALLYTSYISYSPLGQPTKVYESPNGGSANRRTTNSTYDTAGRQTNWQQEGPGVSIPETQTLYSSSTGRPTTQRFVCGTCDDQATTTSYDALGRATAYQDADGNTSTVTYDFMGRPVTTGDGKGTQTFTYDPTSGLLVKLEDSAAGAFTASYDADGNLVERGLPNGLVAKATYDETGAPVHLRYDKVINCLSNCTWLDFDVEESIQGQWLAQTNTLSSQQYSYDKAGRLTLVKDTPQGGGCTTRSYSYDADSNRTKLITRQPGIGGVCDTTSAGTTQNYSYDAGDRLIVSGITYDSHGRITSLPSAYSGGGTLTSTYYTNDLVRSQTQDGITNTYELDAALRQRRRVQTGAKSGTEIYHYADGSDSPAWIDRGSSWSRNITGVGGELAAVQDSSTGTTLQLTNLHGDIVATASLSIEATKPLATFEFDEFGNPKQTGSPKYGWLGGKGRRTELPSGVVQMGVRSYVPAMGRFTMIDPVLGGSANAYEYAMGDPVSNFDLSGTAVEGGIECTQRAHHPHKSSHRVGRVNAVATIKCRSFGNTSGQIVSGTIKATLFRNGRRVTSSGKVPFEVYAMPIPKPFKVPVNVPCKSGVYRLRVDVVVKFPPGIEPPVVKNYATSRPVVIRC
jgi:RHS repeat-associated protein